MIWWIIILVNYTLFAPFTVSVNPYTDTVIIKIWLADCHFKLKQPNAFSAFHPAANQCQLKCLYCLLVAWQYSTQELVFGMIITDPEHWRLRLKWWDYRSADPPINPTMQSAAGSFWFLMSSCQGFVSSHPMDFYLEENFFWEETPKGHRVCDNNKLIWWEFSPLVTGM